MSLLSLLFGPGLRRTSRRMVELGRSGRRGISLARAHVIEGRAAVVQRDAPRSGSRTPSPAPSTPTRPAPHVQIASPTSRVSEDPSAVNPASEALDADDSEYVIDTDLTKRERRSR